MGKSQKKRAMRRHNPVRVPDSHLPHGLDAAARTSARKDEVLPIIQKLEGIEAQDRTWACSAVSNLIQNDPSTRRLLQGKNIVGVLITRLSDSIDEVVVEAAGALRNLCVDGGYEICAEMYNKSILSPLKTFIPKISSALDQYILNPKSAPENVTELVFNLAENVITLLWCLSETSNKALNAINEMHLAPFLMAFLRNHEKLPSRTVAAAAQCLYVLTDDNISVTEDIRSISSYTSCLLSLATSSDTTPPVPTPSDGKDGKELAEERFISVKILSAGILRNISPIPAPSLASTIDIDRGVVLPLLLPVLSKVSLPEASERVTELMSKEGEPSIDKPPPKNTPKSDHRTPTERELEHVEAKLRNVQLSLEILTGLCATLPEPEPNTVDGQEDDDDDDGDADGDGEGDDVDDIEMDTVALDEKPTINGTTTTTNTAGAPNTNTSILPSIVSPLLKLIQPTPLSFPPLPPSSGGAAPLEERPKTHAPTTSALAAIHIGALECLNNVFLSLAIDSSGGSSSSSDSGAASDVAAGRSVWDGVWAALVLVGVESVGSPGQERRKEMWDVAVGVLWGVGGIWRGSIVPDEEQLKVLIQICDSSTDDQLRVKCIGALECLAQHKDSIRANMIISTYLLTILSAKPTPATTSPEPILQAASAIIDIYSDESMPYDVNFRQGGFLQSLSASLDNVKRAVKSINRKKEGGKVLRMRGEEILDNLRAFIKYRRDLKF